MKISIRSLSILVLLTSCSCLGGCIKFYGYRDVTVSVRDAETNQPISHARVDVKYLYMMVINAPKPTYGNTDADGIAVIHAANFDGQDWKASAEGFLSDQRPFFDNESRADFKLYREPAPTIEIIVPNGFRGPLLIDRRPVTDWIQGETGHRVFTYHASSNGYVAIDATPLLMGFDIFKLEARFENGAPIPRRDLVGTGPGTIALRWVDASWPRDLFVVGTESDIEKLHPIIYDYKNGDPHTISLNHTALNALFDAVATPKPANLKRD